MDHALVTSTSSGILLNAGHLLENLVFTALRRSHQNVYYYKTSAGKEVDFVVAARSGPKELVQLRESLADPKTRAREVGALNDAMGELGLKQATLVTRGESDEIKCDVGAIRVMPAWQFLLELPDSTETPD